MKLSPTAMVRVMCLECLGASTAGSAFDCGSQFCALYAATPFRGRPKPKSCGDGPEPEYELRYAAKAKKLRPKRQASRKLIRAFCKECQVDSVARCKQTGCPVFGLTPYQAGGQPKQNRTNKQREAASETMRGVQKTKRLRGR